MTHDYQTAKEMINQAFIELMKEKNYLKISVSDVVRKAGVARASFYRNYNSISEIIDDITDEVYTEIQEDMLPVFKGNNERLWRDFLFKLFYRFPQKHMATYSSKQENVGVWFSKMDVKIQELQDKMNTTSIKEKYTPFAKMSLVMNILKQWINTGMNESPEEMVNYLMNFIISF